LNLSYEELEHFGFSALEKVGVPNDDAAATLHALLLSDLRGIDSHGIRLLPIYIQRIEAGGVARTPDIRVLCDSAATALLDGGSGLGQVVGARAMRLAIDKASKVGAAFVTARNSTHCGSAGSHAMLALDCDMIGACFSNTFASMAVWGAAGSSIGNNPMAIAVPTGRHAPFVLDMATSITSWQRIYMAMERGEKIAPGMVLDPQGKPTDDPKNARGGTILPMAGAKGSGLAVAIDLLTGVLSGGAFAKHVGMLITDFSTPENVSTSYIAVDVSHFLPVEEFQRRADQFIDELKASPKAESVPEILMAGEPEHRKMLQRRSQGIPLAAATRESLRKLGDRLGVPLPEHL
jgi:LDH2 family malate/lactate/ureidoglycolate dehydrogenase